MYPTVEYVVYVFEQSAGTSAWTVVTSIASVMIAALAMIFSVQHIKDERKHKILTTRPKIIIQITSPEPNQRGLTLSIVNCGLGPAIINRIEYAIDGNPIEDNVHVRLGTLMRKDVRQDFLYNKPANEQHLAPQENYPLVYLDCDMYQANDVKVRLSQRLDIQIAYSSIYGDKFLTEL